MKKRLFAMLVLVSILFTGCSASENNTQSTFSSSTKEESKSFQVGISQFAEHPALDALREGFVQELVDQGIDVEIDYKNAQTDMGMNSLIAEKFAQENKDLVLTITTISAQGAKGSITSIPVLFSAVTDPLSAQLVDDMNAPGKNFSGTTDAAPIEKQLQLFRDILPSIERIGIIYNTGEANSLAQIQQAKDIAEKIGLHIETVGITNVNEIPQAVDSILQKVEGLYTIADNTVASSIQFIAEKAMAKGVLTIGVERAHVESGILMTNGINYSLLGKQTAQMAKRILVDKESISTMPVESLSKTEKVVNLATLKKLGLDENADIFSDCIKLDQ